MKSLLLLALVSTSLLQAEPLISWKRVQLTNQFYAEGVNQGDINKDGHADIISGPFWYEGPDWKNPHAFYEPKVFDIVGYSDNFFCYPQDFNGDGWLDILVLGFPGKEARLYLSPGQFEKDTPWEMHIVADVVDNESPVFTDITGDGKPEIVCSRKGHFGWYAPNWEKPTEAWPFVPISDDVKVAKFTHGLGVGDVDGDGQMDLMESRRWWQAGTESKTAPWAPHTFSAGGSGGAQIFAYDFDGDGRNDIATALSAHRYGVSVFLNRAGDDGAQWNRRNLVTEQPFDNDYGIVFSQPHAMYLADMDGDGVKDIVTGKRYWAHNGHGDPDEHGPRVVYWFQAKRDGKGGVEFIPHLVDAESGVGVDVQVADVNGDQFPDILVGNKSGVYVLLQQRQEVTAEVAEQSRPKKMYGPALMPNQEYKQGQSPEEAVKSMQLPAGFKAELIASEPEVVQPIAMCWDERGRLWVVEGNSYPLPREPGAGQDRILILEDADGNGSFETRKVFAEGISLASGIEVGFGGVWVGAAPYMMFIPDVDRDDKPDATDARYADYQKVPGLPFTAYALLDGWGSQDTHETLNSFIWGPDGWLYGCHGVFTHSKVGKPGTQDEQRVPINAGVWRYHPIRHEFEVYAEGTSNPWGLDYDEHGEFFVTACVIPHLYHIVPGGRYQRQAGQHFNPYTYDDIKTIADHAHYAGNLRPGNLDKTTGAGIVSDTTNALGGGHAHCGLAIYQSSQFPASYRNQLIFGNLHGHRLVTDYLDPKGSTYIGKHGSDFMRSNDTHFIPVTQKVGPDGFLYVSDWSDQQICHRGSKAVENWDRSNGRIYRVSYGSEGSVGTPARLSNHGGKAAKHNEANDRAPVIPNAPFDLTKETDVTLAELAVQTENEWFSRMARRVMMERHNEGEPGDILAGKGLHMDIRYKLYDILTSEYEGDLKAYSRPVIERLRALWLLVDTNNFNALYGGDFKLLKLKEPAVIAQVIRYTRKSSDQKEHQIVYQEMPPQLQIFLTNLTDLAKNTTSSVVRRELASFLHGSFYTFERDIATALLQHEEDKDDPYIPLLIWYGIEPIVGADAQTGLELAKASKMPKVTEFIYRRLSSDDAGRAALLRALASQGAAFDPAAKEPILSAVLNAARQSGKLSAPGDWATIAAGLREAATPPVLSLVQELSALFGDAPALTHYREALADAQQPVNDRLAALAILRQAGDAGTAKVLHDLVTRQDSPSPLRRLGI
ncbi:MAG: FG-GAP-like repeat-containing protein, partial [Prosthecobacter sp.]|nr:FG-GAP-like repeat-containing protein [Prosthecobacter sp.]